MRKHEHRQKWVTSKGNHNTEHSFMARYDEVDAECSIDY
jgi:hypothetical protein